MNRQTAFSSQHELQAAPQLASGLLQRKCDCGQHTIGGGECSTCSRERETTLQRSAISPEPVSGHDHVVPAIVHEVLGAPGQPLEESARGFMEQRFGYDFSRVRVHTDAPAAQSARAVNALAYTVGRDIVFAEGQYAPGISTGQRLLAHELVHVVQQAGAASKSSGSLVLGDMGSAGELEADQLSDQLIRVPMAATPSALSQNRPSCEAAPPGNSAVHGQIQRQVPAAVPVVGVAITAANFAMSLRPAGQGGLTETDVQFRYARSESGPHPIREDKHVVFYIDTIKGLGCSWGFWKLVLRYDGHSIISAYTQQDRIEGYDGGTFGSEAAVNFAAVEAGSPTEAVTSAYLIFSGFNNPSGPGFQRFTGRLLVEGDGTVTPEECELTEGDGYARVGHYWCAVGWD
jgi:hypothetical protein